MPATLRLDEDVLSNAAAPIGLPALPRLIFIVHGSAMIAGAAFSDGEAWQGRGRRT